MMRRPSGSDFLGLGNTLRSLTLSPATAAIQAAHHAAQIRLEAGGAVASSPKPVKADPVPADYVLPPDVRADEIVKAIEAELQKRGGLPNGAPPLIERRAGGRVVVPGAYVLRLGGGHHGRGSRFLYAVITAIRGRGRGLGQPRSGCL